MTCSPTKLFKQIERKVIAILRGIRPDETEVIIDALVRAGIRIIEIPLNSPDAFTSIGIARQTAPDDCLIGAGTVLTSGEVDQLKEVGGNIVVSPNVNPEVIARTRELGMLSMPGVFTASEALMAVGAGAGVLKFFPADLLGPGGINAIRAVLPADAMIGAVGGISNADFVTYTTNGISIFGIGSSIYKPGINADTIHARACRCVEAYDAATSSYSA